MNPQTNISNKESILMFSSNSEAKATDSLQRTSVNCTLGTTYMFQNYRIVCCPLRKGHHYACKSNTRNLKILTCYKYSLQNFSRSFFVTYDSMEVMTPMTDIDTITTISRFKQMSFCARHVYCARTSTFIYDGITYDVGMSSRHSFEIVLDP